MTFFLNPLSLYLPFIKAFTLLPLFITITLIYYIYIIYYYYINIIVLTTAIHLLLLLIT